jgi:hypothetical protein
MQLVEAEFLKDVAARTKLRGPDALAEIFHRAASAPPRGRAPEPVVNLLVVQHTAEVLVTRHRLIPFLDDAVMSLMQGYVRRIVVDDDDNVVLNMGRKRRLFTGATHVGEWDCDHGRTDADNGRPRCHRHNRVTTRLGLVDRRSRGGRIITCRRDGTAMHNA